MSDNELIRRSQNGDTTAFGELVRRHEVRLFRFVRNLIADHHAVEDLAQDIFLAAYRYLGRFAASRGSFRAWLFTIARNRCANHVKRERLRRHEAMVDFSDYRATGDSLEQEEFFRRLDAELARLPFDQRVAFVLIELEELSYQQAAAIEEAQVGTIKSRVHRAKQKLKASLSSFVGESK